MWLSLPPEGLAGSEGTQGGCALRERATPATHSSNREVIVLLPTGEERRPALRSFGTTSSPLP